MNNIVFVNNTTNNTASTKDPPVQGAEDKGLGVPYKPQTAKKENLWAVDYKHHWHIDQHKWWVRLFMWLWQVEATDITFCKLFWGLFFPPTFLFGLYARLIVETIGFAFRMVAKPFLAFGRRLTSGQPWRCDSCGVEHLPHLETCPLYKPPKVPKSKEERLMPRTLKRIEDTGTALKVRIEGAAYTVGHTPAVVLPAKVVYTPVRITGKATGRVVAVSAQTTRRGAKRLLNGAIKSLDFLVERIPVRVGWTVMGLSGLSWMGLLLWAGLTINHPFKALKEIAGGDSFAPLFVAGVVTLFAVLFVCCALSYWDPEGYVLLPAKLLIRTGRKGGIGFFAAFRISYLGLKSNTCPKVHLQDTKR